MKRIFIFCALAFSITAEAQQNLEEAQEKLPKKKGVCTNPHVTSYHTHHGSTGKIYTYEYKLENLNPNEDCYVKPRYLKDRIYIKINDINRMAYDVKIKDSTFSVTLPNVSIFDTLLAQIGSAGSASEDTKTVEKADAPGQKTVGDALFAEVQANKRYKANTKIVSGVKKLNDPFFEQKNQIAELQENINTVYPQLFQKLKDLEAFDKFGQNVPILIANECCSMQGLQIKIKNDSKIQSLFGGIMFQEISSKINDILIIVDEIKGLEKNINDDKAAIKKLIDGIKRNCKEDGNILFGFCDTEALEEDKYPDDLAKVMEAAGKVDKQKVSDAITLLQGILAQAGNPLNFSFLSKSFIGKGDELIIDTEIKPANSSISKLDKRYLNHTLDVRGKFEWAIGPTLTFHFGKSLFDETFSIDTILSHPDSGKYLITKNDVRTRLVPSLGLMANFYWQRHSAVTPGIAVGLATSTANLSEVKAYLGASLLLGGLNEKLLFNLGVAFGSVNRLKPNLKEGINSKDQIPFTGDKVGAPDDLVEKVFRAGVFFGFSYKLN